MKISLNKAYSFKQKGQRDNQEDARYPDMDSSENFSFVVCDGVGGNDAGEVASASVSKTMGEMLDGISKDKPFTYDTLSRILAKAYSVLRSHRDKGSYNMATTMTTVVFHAGGVTMAHIGDSRIYQFRKDVGICYRSTDHSLVQELVSCGQLTEEQARNHPKSNIITRSMSARDADPCSATAFTTIDVMEGDVFLLCTDGVLSEITDSELTELFLSDLPDCEKMTRLAEISRDSQDNNTASMVSVKDVVLDSDDAASLYPDEPVDVVSADTSSLKDKVSEFIGLLFK